MPLHRIRDDRRCDSRRRSSDEVERDPRIGGTTAMKYVGKGVPMMTNRRLAMGRGTFTADVKLPKLCWLVVLRSPYAHARLISIDVTKAKAVPGVLDVVDGNEIAGAVGPSPKAADPVAFGGRARPSYALATDRVGFVGEAVAAVVAEDRYAAHRAVQEIVVEYEELLVVSDPEDALRPGSPRVELDWLDNILMQ